MKRVFAFLMVVGLVALMVGSGFAAWFTDQETVQNDFAAGLLNIDLTGDGSTGVTMALPDTTAGGTGQQGGMAPGVTEGPYYINVFNKPNNASTLPVKYRFRGQKTGGSMAFFDKLWVKVQHGNCVEGGISNKYVVYEGWLKNLYFDSSQAISAQLDPNISHCYEFLFTLHKSAENDLQGKAVEFELVVDATQTDNPGWAE